MPDVLSGVPRETIEKLKALQAMVIEEVGRQNLISLKTVDDFWNRHIVDSAMLLPFGRSDGVWLDLGTGAGFPGLVIALLRTEPVVLVESRRLRAEFLQTVIESLGILNSRCLWRALEAIDTFEATTISARAFAPLPRLLELSHRFSTPTTQWVLPKGRTARAELASISETWQGDFRLEPSMTDPESSIIVATNVSPRLQR